MIEEPKNIVFRRPKRSPIHIVSIEPKKHPTLYDAMEMPSPDKLGSNGCTLTWVITTLYSPSMGLLGFSESFNIGGINLRESFCLKNQQSNPEHTSHASLLQRMVR